ncbi:hypothetical protein EKO27_g11372 [Xylaria grammica]|uniref:Uncharacterized protein n=1 Tax=Xylaria grammica TaxID=363999 RepID=A0A439CNJ1_9PEZI|nr:hypothetical protein EKO27_g11372 [Xylaria grammica]
MPSALSTVLLSFLGIGSATAATVYLAGDSTMARAGGGSGTEGWGEFLRYSLPSSYTVSNKAIGGRSARSYTREGRFQEIANVVKSGDWVVVEFGHNDGGSLSPTDNGRTDCFGDGNQTCQTTYNGVAETVLTYPTYYKNAATLFLAKGAKVILSSATPNNICETGACSWGPSRFDYYACSEARQPAFYHVAHGQYSAQAMTNLGTATVNAHYPNDHTHTDAYMANVMAGKYLTLLTPQHLSPTPLSRYPSCDGGQLMISAGSFVLGLKCGTSALGAAVTNSTASLTASSYGPCIAFNSTVPI